ncbi:MAG TPA: MG2 domain-containing protein, partial [Elusimicrobiota bacterium]|nr:MG2 domain-containing protein [Elusimicrobiota bacterium]
LLESYLPPAHPVRLVNVERAQVGMAYVPPDKIIAFHKSINWSGQAPTPLDELGGVQTDWAPKAARNRRAQLPLALKPALGKRSSGVVFVQVQDPHGNWEKAFVNVTRLGVTAKTSPDSTLVWVTFLRTGLPVSGARVELRGPDGASLFSGVTGTDGTLSAPGWKGLGIKTWKRWARPELWVFASLGNDFAALSTSWNGGLDSWRFGVNYDAHPRPWRYDAALFTERGVYRSGETVHLKGIVRELVRGEWERAGLRAVHVTVVDPREAEVFKSTLTLSEFSSFDLDYPVAEGAPTGSWKIRVSDLAEAPREKTAVVQEEPNDEEGEPEEAPNGEKRLNAQAEFRVEAFKPASFEVHAAPGKGEYLAGEAFSAAIDGWYLFGAPMADAPYEWKLRLSPSAFTPPGFEGYSFEPGWWEEDHRESRLLASGTGMLSAQGKGEAAATLDLAGSVRPMAATLEASVMSPERQRLFGRAAAIVHGANLYLGVRPSKTFLEKGQPWSADLAAVRPDGSPAQGTEVSASLIRRQWLSVQKAGLGGRLEWVTEQKDTEVSSFTFVASRSTTSWSYTPTAVGQYLLKLSGKDEDGRAVAAGDSFYVTGKGESWWARSDNDLVELVPDKKSYKPGETARILVKSPFERCRALVTVERERVLERRVIQLEGGADFLRIPIRAEHAPNVYVGVVLLQGRTGLDRYSALGEDVAKPQAKFGYASLPVDPGGHRLEVEVRTDTGTYRPGGTVSASVSVKDQNGRPVAAEVTLFAVDEGVLALTGYATPDPFAEFYGPRPLLLGASSLLPYIIGQRSFGEKGESRGGGGGAGGMDGIDLRSRFLPTAYWSPSLRSGPDGRVRTSFKLPDNLSRFRLMAVVHEGRAFGSGQSRFVVSKPLLLRPSLPRFARTGDAFRGGAALHNYTAQDATVRLSLSLSGGAVRAEGERIRDVLVPAGKAVEVLWPMTAAAVGKTKIQLRAGVLLSSAPVRLGEKDGLEWPLAVQLPQPLEHVATSGATESSARELVRLPVGVSSGSLEASLSPTAMAGLSEGARFLLGYPYGCLEQRMSRAFPVLVGADLTATFGLGNVDALKAKAREVFTRLPEFQHSSGGFGYWPNPILPDPYLTAYVLHGAAIAKREGYAVDPEVLRRATSWLRSNLYSRSDWAYPYRRSEEYAMRAYALYALALHGVREPGEMNNLFLRRDQLPLEAQAHLLKAAKLLDAPPATLKALRDMLLSRARYSPTTMHFEDPDDQEFLWIHGSAARTTATVLQAILEASGAFAGDDKAVRWLMEERKDLGRWRTTQENAVALYALQDYFRRYEKETPAFTATVALAAQAWKEEFQGRTLEARRKSFALAGAEPIEVRVSKEGTGRLYYVLRAGYPAPKDRPAQSEGLSVKKEVRSLYGGGARLRPGERGVVTLTVETPQDRTFVVLDDPVPAGYEIVDASYAVESSEDAAALEQAAGARPWWGSFFRSEKYDDRIAVFADYLTAGTHTYSYLVQATTPGTYWTPPTRVEQMYQPEVFGTAAGTDARVGDEP